jgi:hypothetical protein
MPSRHRTSVGRHLRISVRWTMALLVVTMGCTSAVEPLSNVTLLVRNTTCDPGPCQAIRVLAFPNNQPLTPGGAWSIDLGVVTTAIACLTIPPSAHFDVTDAGTGGVTVTRWTTNDALALAPWSPSDARFTAGPTTPSFVPATSMSWSVALPGSAVPAAAEGCDP